MNRLRCIAVAWAFGALLPMTASAQDSGQIGVSMGYPGSIGLIWHISDAVAVGPDFMFRHSAGDGTTSTSTGIGIAARWYFARYDALRLYVAPHFQYSRSVFEDQIRFGFPDLTPGELAALGLNIDTSAATYKAINSSKSFTGSFGAQYALHKRFGVFGEAGLQYSRVSPPDISDPLPNSFVVTVPLDGGPHSWGTTTAVGVIVYFKD